MKRSPERPLRVFADVQLGRQRSPEQASGPFMVRYLRAANVKDGSLDLSDVKQMNFAPAEQHVFALQEGDVLVSEGAGSLTAVGASAVWDGSIQGTVCFQNTLLRLRPREGLVTPRFLAWWARHAHGSRLFSSVAVGVNIYHLSAERVRALPVRFPGTAEQERVALFLDRETARMAALAERRIRIKQLLDKRLESRISDRIDSIAGRHGSQALRRLANVSFSSVDKKSVDRERTVRVCNYTDVYYQAEITSDLDLKIATATKEQITRFSLRGGDVLLTKDSETPDDIGVPAWVPKDLGGVVCGYHLALIRPHSDLLRGDYLYWTLRSVRGRQQVSAAANGVTRFGLRTDTIQAIEVPVPPLDVQAAVAHELRTAASSTKRARATLLTQVDRLRERRQALITAAVTGEKSMDDVA